MLSFGHNPFPAGSNANQGGTSHQKPHTNVSGTSTTESRILGILRQDAQRHLQRGAGLRGGCFAERIWQELEMWAVGQEGHICGAWRDKAHLSGQAWPEHLRPQRQYQAGGHVLSRPPGVGWRQGGAA